MGEVAPYIKATFANIGNCSIELTEDVGLAEDET